MYRQRFMDLIRQVPRGVWFMALGLSVQFSPVLVYKIKGGAVICAIFALGMLFCQSKYCREGFFRALSQAVNDNSAKCTLLFIFYTLSIAAWFYAPYNISYVDIQHIWKKMLLNIVAVVIGLFMSRYPQFIKTVLIMCIPCALFQTGFMGRVASEGLEARSLLGESDGGVLGGFTQWESIGMLAVMLVGLLMTVQNKMVKIVLGGLAVFFSWTTLKAGYATPFALLLIGYGMIGVGYLRFGSSRRTNAMLKIGVFMLCVVGALMVFYKVASSVDTGKEASESIAMRFYNFMKDPRGGGYDVEHSRFREMSTAIRSFCKWPIFGGGGEYPSPRYDVSSGHYSMLDNFAHYGIIGGGSYLIFVLLTMSYLYKRYKRTRDWLDCAKFAVSIMFFVGGVVNPGWRELPMSTYLILCAPFVNRSELSYRRFYEPMPPPNMPYYGGVY